MPQLKVAMPIWAQAGLWGLLGSSSLVLGAVLAYLVNLPKRITAGIMAFGCGVLVSAIAYDLIMEGFLQGGLWPIVFGALAGSAAYTLANWLVTRGGGKHRKRSRHPQREDNRNNQGSGLAIAIGTLLDGIPESLVLGVGVLSQGTVSYAVLAAVFLSNLPEALSSSVGLRAAGHGKVFVLGLWIGIAAMSGIAALVGAALLGGASPWVLATVNAVAAGALLTMIADTMIPEAVEDEPEGTGALVVLGLLVAFALSQSLG